MDSLFSSTGRRPLFTLSLLFGLWKAFILAIAILSPGTGYDASTLQLFTIAQQSSSSPFPASPAFSTHPLSHLALKLSRWDAIYFLPIARRGYLWEQEWAFGWGWTKLIGLAAAPFVNATDSGLVAEAIAGILIAHFAHFASVLVLYHLTLRLTPPSTPARQSLAFVAAALHVIAPAGIFLSAPFGEALTSFLTFAGTLLYCYSTPLTTIASGVIFGLAATVRSNVLLNGTLFLGDVLLRHLPTLYSTYSRGGNRIDTTALNHLFASVTAGTALATGFIIPQAIAWTTLCQPIPAAERAAWCHALPPSVYTHVQRKYWNVGFLRYWTLPNIPLFALAAPMITALVWSAIDTLRAPTSASAPPPAARAAGSTVKTRLIVSRTLRSIAVPQLLLALLATTSFHVQIITRIASSCPLLYIWLARKIVHGPPSCNGSGKGGMGSSSGKQPQRAQGDADADVMVSLPWRMTETAEVRYSQVAVRYMVVYAVVQAGLFASFLPPA